MKKNISKKIEFFLLYISGIFWQKKNIFDFSHSESGNQLQMHFLIEIKML